MQEILAKLILLLYGRFELLSSDVASLQLKTFGGGMIWLIVGLMLAAALAVLAYSRTTQAITFKARVLLGLLRWASLAIIVLGLIGTSVVIGYAQLEKPIIGVLVDESRSMAVKNGNQTRAKARQSAQVVLERDLENRYELRTFPAGDGSISQQVQNLFCNANTSGASAYVLLTDGRDSAIDGIDSTASLAPAPVYAVSLGEDQPPRDIAVLRVVPREFAYEKDETLVRATLASAGFDDKVDVAIEDENGRSVATKRVEVKSGEPVEVFLTFTPHGAGMKRYVFRTAEMPGEATYDNNKCEFYVDVRRDKIKVLYVETLNGFNYRHIKQILESDPAIEPSCLICMSDNEWLLQGRQTREDGKPVVSRVADGFPANEKELFEFDVLILGDLERKFFEVGGRFNLIKRFLTQRGGGLMTIGGLSSYGAGDFENTPLAEILPVMVRREKKKQIRNLFKIQLSEAALTHPAMQLEYDPVENLAAWQSLPEVEGGSVIYGPKAGATVLAYHPYLKNKYGPRVIMAAGRYGGGRVLASALDTTYLWRLGRGDDEPRYFRRYWGLVVRWLAADPKERGVKRALYLDRNVLEAGGSVKLMTAVRDKDFNPVFDADVSFYVTPPGGVESEHKAQSARDIPGLYWYEAKLPKQGEYAFALKIKTGEEEFKDQLACVVQPSRQELKNLAPDAKGLAALCSVSGGKIVEDAAEIKNLLQVEPQARAGIVIIEIWRALPTMVVLVILLGIEWLLRKRRGLA